MKRTILSINSNKPMSYLLQTVISDSYNIMTVPDVFTGMDEIRRDDEIGLVIVDTDFVEKENWDFIEHISSSGLYQKPVIVLTSDRSKKMNDLMAEFKVKDLFLKPFSPPELMRKIEKVMAVEVISN